MEIMRDIDGDKLKVNKGMRVNYPLRFDGMELVRKGKCNPAYCQSACCKVFIVTKAGKVDDYVSFFFDKSNKFGDHVLVRNCKHLDIKTNKCNVWGTKDFPQVCSQFPEPADGVYRHVFDTCSFRFEMQPIEIVSKKKDLNYNLVEALEER